MATDFLDPEAVTDRESFVRFLKALLADRQQAEILERSDPEMYSSGGANNWQNTSISAFLECALAGAEAQDEWGHSSGLSWQDLAVFLFLGKIYE